MSKKLENVTGQGQNLSVGLEVQPQNTPIDGQVSLIATPTVGYVGD